MSETAGELTEGEAGRALSALRRGIAEREFTDGRIPPERELALSLSVGRRALRRALDVLESEGLIWRRQGHGTFIGLPPLPSAGEARVLAQHTSPREMMEVRLELEPILARYCASRATGAEVSAMRRAAQKAAEAATAGEYETWDGAFHRRIAECAGNKLFLAMFDTIMAVRRETGWSKLRERTFARDRLPDLAAEHEDIIAAIEGRDAAAADAAMSRHLGQVAAAMLG